MHGTPFSSSALLAPYASFFRGTGAPHFTYRPSSFYMPDAGIFFSFVHERAHCAAAFFDPPFLLLVLAALLSRPRPLFDDDDDPLSLTPSGDPTPAARAHGRKLIDRAPGHAALLTLTCSLLLFGGALSSLPRHTTAARSGPPLTRLSPLFVNLVQSDRSMVFPLLPSHLRQGGGGRRVTPRVAVSDAHAVLQTAFIPLRAISDNLE